MSNLEHSPDRIMIATRAELDAAEERRRSDARHVPIATAAELENASLRRQLAGAVGAMEAARSALKRRMLSDDTLDLPYDEDMADAIKRLDAALSSPRTNVTNGDTNG